MFFVWLALILSRRVFQIFAVLKYLHSWWSLWRCYDAISADVVHEPINDFGLRGRRVWRPHKAVDLEESCNEFSSEETWQPFQCIRCGSGAYGLKKWTVHWNVIYHEHHSIKLWHIAYETIRVQKEVTHQKRPEEPWPVNKQGKHLNVSSVMQRSQNVCTCFKPRYVTWDLVSGKLNTSGLPPALLFCKPFLLTKQ